MASVAVAPAAEAFKAIDQEMGIQLEVRMLTGRTVVPLRHFLASASIASVKEAVHAATGIPARHQRLIWQADVLGHGTLLSDLSLPLEGAALQLVVSLPPEHQVAQAATLMQQAAAALEVLDVRSLSELKQLSSPPGGVDLVLAAVMHLRAGIDPSIAIDSRGRVKDSSWKASRNMINEPKKFIANIKEFKALVEDGCVPAQNVQAACRIQDSMGDVFTYETMRRKSLAAAGLTSWVCNIIQYHQVCQQLRVEFEGFDIMTEIKEQMVQ